MKAKTLISYGVLVLAILFCNGFFLLSQEKSPDRSNKKVPAEYRVKKTTFQPELSLQGLVIPDRMDPVVIRLKEFKGTLKVKSIVPSGTSVESEAIILEIEPEPLDKLISDAERVLELKRHSLEQKEKGLKIQELNVQQKLEKARLALSRAQEKKKYHEEIKRPLQKDKSDLDMERKEARLADRKTELEQLEEMYREDDIAGKTKDIVLGRARRNVALATRSLELARRELAYKREVKQPRQIKDLANTEKWAKENLHITESQTALNLVATRQAITNLKLKIQKQADRLERLKTDKEQFVVKAPQAGIAVHGNMTQRLVLKKAPGGKEIKTGDTVMPNQPILVIYLDEGYQVKAAIPEQARYLVKSDNPAQVYVKALPDKIFKATISKIAGLPDGLSSQSRTFSAQLALEDTDKRLYPGLTCTILFKLDELTNVIVIPAGLIKVKHGQSFVNLVEEETIVSRKVIIGARRAGQIWVAAGLKEGDVIVLRK